ncbi:hypothetical protein HK405_003686 [Cladochytrium tenue]|nr:hypothetical protein HK405_003686 [Cladochytrium tenue]
MSPTAEVYQPLTSHSTKTNSMLSTLPPSASSPPTPPPDYDANTESTDSRRARAADRRTRLRRLVASCTAATAITLDGELDDVVNATIPSPHLPAATLAVSRDSGRHLRAAVPLPRGAPVLAEVAAAYAVLRDHLDSRCARCLGPIPSSSAASTECCPGCIRQTFYCSAACRRADARRHTPQCQALRQLTGIAASHEVDYTLLRLVVDVLARGAMHHDCGDGVVGLEKEEWPTPTPVECVDDLLAHQRGADPAWIAAVDAAVRDLHSSLPPARRPTSTTPDSLLALACRINTNAHGIADPTAVGPAASASTVAVGLFPCVALLNHSCAPNCAYVPDAAAARLVVRAIRDVQEGEELTVAYVSLLMSREDRRASLLETKRFLCRCVRCDARGYNSGEDDNVEAVAGRASTSAFVARLARADVELNALVCPVCRSPEAVLVPASSANAHTSTNDDHDDAPLACPACSLSVPRADVTARLAAAASSFAAASDLACRGGPAAASAPALAAASASLQDWLAANVLPSSAYKQQSSAASSTSATSSRLLLHPRHHLATDVYAHLARVLPPLARFPAAAAAAARVAAATAAVLGAGATGEAAATGGNEDPAWPDLADAWLRAGAAADAAADAALDEAGGLPTNDVDEAAEELDVVFEALGAAASSGNEAATPATEWRRAAVLAYSRSTGIRAAIFGARHPRTVAAAEARNAAECALREQEAE